MDSWSAIAQLNVDWTIPESFPQCGRNALYINVLRRIWYAECCDQEPLHKPKHRILNYIRTCSFMFCWETALNKQANTYWYRLIAKHEMQYLRDADALCMHPDAHGIPQAQTYLYSAFIVCSHWSFAVQVQRFAVDISRLGVIRYFNFRLYKFWFIQLYRHIYIYLYEI